MENLSRFIKSKSLYSELNNRVKSAAFLPLMNNDRDRYETSVFFIDNLSDEEIWYLGNKHIREKQIKARADFTTPDVVSSELNIDFNNDPERHADIIGWSDFKPKQKEQALKLAEKSKLLVSPILNQTHISN